MCVRVCVCGWCWWGSVCVLAHAHVVVFYMYYGCFLFYLFSCVSSDNSWQLCYQGNLTTNFCGPWPYINQWNSVTVRIKFTNEKRNDLVTTVFPSLPVREHSKLYWLIPTSQKPVHPFTWFSFRTREILESMVSCTYLFLLLWNPFILSPGSISTQGRC